MKRVGIGCAVLLVLFLIVAGISVGVGKYRGSVRSGTWLELQLDGDLLEYRPPTLVGALLMQDKPLLRDVTDALDQAAADPKIEGVVARIGSIGTGWGRTGEIRDHVLSYRKSGKPAVCFFETGGEFGPGKLEYYLASGFDRIYLAPPGDINLVGEMSSSMFLRGTFDLLGIYPDMEHIGYYKTAM